MASFEANVADRFPGASKLDVLSGNDRVKQVSVGKDGSVRVEGLDNGSYVLSDGSRSVSFNVKDVQSARTRLGREAQAAEQRAAQAEQLRKNPALASAAPGETTTVNTITGARSSMDGKRKVADPHPQPFVNQMDVEGVPQRSDTPFGEAHPIPKAELQTEKDPEKARERLEGEPMRSDTELGSQPVIPKGEIQADLKHDEVGVDPDPKVPLASDTELGSKPPAFVSNEVPAEDSPPVAKPQQVPSESVREPAAKPKARRK